MISHSANLQIRSELLIAMAGLGYVQGRVAWRTASQAGVQFAAPISTKRVFAAIVEAYKARLPSPQ
jgi:hypothetical protein